MCLDLGVESQSLALALEVLGGHWRSLEVNSLPLEAKSLALSLPALTQRLDRHATTLLSK